MIYRLVESPSQTTVRYPLIQDLNLTECVQQRKLILL